MLFFQGYVCCLFSTAGFARFLLGAHQWFQGCIFGRIGQTPLVGCGFLVSKRTIFFFWGLVIWMLYVGRARHPGPRIVRASPGFLSVEFANIGSWLTYGILLWVAVLSSWL